MIDSTPVCRPSAIALVGSIVVMLLSAGAMSTARAATPGPTGDAKAIAFNRQVQQAYSTVPGVRIVQRGLLFARKVGRNGYKFQIGRARRFRPANETLNFVLSNGTQTAYADQLVTSGVGRFSILVNSSGLFTSGLGGDGCWQQTDLSAALDGPPGEAFFTVEGHYFPLKRRGSLVLSRSILVIGPGAKATQVNAIDPITHLVVSGRMTLNFVPKQHVKVTQKFTPLSAAPTLPVPHMC
jgi:hypothetical protein